MTLSELEPACEGNAILVECFEDLRISCIRYAEAVCAFHETRIGLSEGLMTQEDMRQADSARRVAHNTMMDSTNILARSMRRAERDSNWIRALVPSRLHYGRFAIDASFQLILTCPPPAEMLRAFDDLPEIHEVMNTEPRVASDTRDDASKLGGAELRAIFAYVRGTLSMVRQGSSLSDVQPQRVDDIVHGRLVHAAQVMAW